MRERIVAQTGLTGDPKKRTRFSRSNSLKSTRILCRHLRKLQIISPSVEWIVRANSQCDQLPQACFDVEIIDIVVRVIGERLVIGAALNPECKTPVKFVVSLFE